MGNRQKKKGKEEGKKRGGKRKSTSHSKGCRFHVTFLLCSSTGQAYRIDLIPGFFYLKSKVNIHLNRQMKFTL